MCQDGRYVALTGTTCGPERLLAVLRNFDDQFADSSKKSIVARMIYETPPFGTMAAPKKEESDVKINQDLAQNIRILVVDGK
jgi:hypothetical protein